MVEHSVDGPAQIHVFYANEQPQISRMKRVELIGYGYREIGTGKIMLIQHNILECSTAKKISTEYRKLSVFLLACDDRILELYAGFFDDNGIPYVW